MARSGPSNGEAGHNGNGARHDLTPSVVRRSVELPANASLLQIVSTHLEDFHQKAEAVGVLDGYGARIHRGDFGEIISRLNVDMTQEVQPVVEFVWNIRPQHMTARFRLLGFRSPKGFGATRYQSEHAVYGDLTVSVDVMTGRATPFYRDFVQEGTYFYTFFLFKKGLFGLFDSYIGLVQFTEAVPSRDWALAQIKKQHEINGIGRKEQLEGEEHKSRIYRAQKTFDDLIGTRGQNTGRLEGIRLTVQKTEQEEAEIENVIADACAKAHDNLHALPRYQNASAHQQRAMDCEVELRYSRLRDELQL